MYKEQAVEMTMKALKKQSDSFRQNRVGKSASEGFGGPIIIYMIPMNDE